MTWNETDRAKLNRVVRQWEAETSVLNTSLETRQEYRLVCKSCGFATHWYNLASQLLDEASRFGWTESPDKTIWLCITCTPD